MKAHNIVETMRRDQRLQADMDRFIAAAHNMQPMRPTAAAKLGGEWNEILDILIFGIAPHIDQIAPPFVLPFEGGNRIANMKRFDIDALEAFTVHLADGEY